VRQGLATQLVEFERRLEQGLERASVIVSEIPDGIEAHGPEAAQTITEEAARLRQAGRAVNSELMIVLARQAPVADDLRLVLALIEVAQHTVLIANQLDLINEQLANIDTGARLPTSGPLSAMTHLAASQLTHAVGAFTSRDLALALRVDVEDDEIDKLNREVFEVAAALERAPDQRDAALRHVLIARSVERIADNAVDIAEEAAFLVTSHRSQFTDASLPRHRTLQGP
jgi:phosphate transport system protein